MAHVAINRMSIWARAAMILLVLGAATASKAKGKAKAKPGATAPVCQDEFKT
jgi:hypothetical protein